MAQMSASLKSEAVPVPSQPPPPPPLPIHYGRTEQQPHMRPKPCHHRTPSPPHALPHHPDPHLPQPHQQQRPLPRWEQSLASLGHDPSFSQPQASELLHRAVIEPTQRSTAIATIHYSMAGPLPPSLPPTLPLSTPSSGPAYPHRVHQQPWNSSSFLQRDHSHAHSSRGEAQPQRLHPPGAFQTQQPLPPPHPSHTAAASGGPVRPVSTPGHAEWQHVDPSWLKPDPASSPPSTAASSLFPSLSLLPPPYHQANHPRAGAGTPGERGAGDKADTYSFGEESFQDFQSPDAPFEAFSFPGNAKGGGDDETKGPNASTAEWSSRSKKLTEVPSLVLQALDQKLSQVPAWDERITKEKLEQLGGVVMVDSSPVLSSAVRNDAIHKYAPKDFHIKCQFCLKSFNGKNALRNFELHAIFWELYLAHPALLLPSTQADSKVEKEHGGLYPCNSIARDVVVYMESRKPVLCNNQRKVWKLQGELFHDTNPFQGRAWLQIPNG
ncbi:hypothetical protein Naga_100917g1 [Nannochloropsis gaditana]|uniref:Uncharacterized protein n=1 Tax=Nannochloropsis gaditana TaxID=72520 RepID=W7TA42_9STRA|nr:hypothetical protein Naga_100917g1 [Nannochloropsis gaditana]